MYLGLCETSKIGLFCENSERLLEKSSIIDV